ncbi:MAG: O-succinylbenzoate synthase, partial [Pontimonas sp.]|nr:O-succinylbenzoate synthase [Pontimonas sp.]
SVVLDAGLGTQSLLADDVVSNPLVARGGILTVAPPTLDSKKLSVLSADDERTDWWHQRLERCLALL